MEKSKDSMLKIIKASLWGTEADEATQADYEEMRLHTITALPAGIIDKIHMSDDLREIWNKEILKHISFTLNCRYYQEKLPLDVPYVILKGTAASQYYPNPDYRTSGDIDVLTSRENFDTACQQLVDAGYRIIEKKEREISLSRNHIIIELHRRFASLNNAHHAKYLDDLIFQSINPSHVLPDPVNGLVLLEHISQHLQNGIGLRQIIDWMMFVDKCLPDEKWPEFSILAHNIGLERLAITATRMCELYLGLSSRRWSAYADVNLCDQLMEYVLSCGNFGNKKVSDEAISESVFAYAQTFKSTHKLLQKQGLRNWKAARKYRILRPFAWVYQANRYIIKGLGRKRATSKIKAEYTAAKKRNAMFDALGVKTAAKGIVVYKDGKYVKK